MPTKRNNRIAKANPITREIYAEICAYAQRREKPDLTAIRDKLGISKSGMHAHILYLESTGWITRERYAEHAKSVIALTDKAIPVYTMPPARVGDKVTIDRPVYTMDGVDLANRSGTVTVIDGTQAVIEWDVAPYTLVAKTDLANLQIVERGHD